MKLKNGKKIMDSYTYSSSLAGQDGVSMNRSPDAGDAGVFVLHNTISTLNSSPGTRSSGAVSESNSQGKQRGGCNKMTIQQGRTP